LTRPDIADWSVSGGLLCITAKKYSIRQQTERRCDHGDDDDDDDNDDDDVACCLAETDGRQDVNVALNRPSFQISTHTDGTNTYYSNFANDGNRETNLHVWPCMHTESETNPWWAVDLLVMLYVAGVKFTNRDSSGMSKTRVRHVH